ncbi:hypothetical protein CR513_44504, partial [Mucuna pruriens]
MWEISEIQKRATTKSANNTTTRQLEQIREIEAQDARSAEVTNKHLEPIHSAPNAPGIQQHPFVDGIMETPLPKGWRGMHLDKYYGTINPDEHLANYLTQLNLFSNENTILCRIFSTSLKGSTFHWYTQLLTNLIDSFEMLKKMFGT